MPEPCQHGPYFRFLYNDLWQKTCGDSSRNRAIFGVPKFQLTAGKRAQYFALLFAGVAQLVEHHLAKVDVESSSLFARSILKPPRSEGVSSF